MTQPLSLEKLGPIFGKEMLFCRLFDYLGRSQPQVRIGKDGPALVHAARDNILNRRALEHCFGTWWPLFGSISRATAGELSCGAGLLEFVGHVSDAARMFGPLRIPVAWALMGMVECQPAPYAVTWEEGEKGRRYLQVTEPFVEELGLVGKVPMPLRLPDFDSVPELFERLCTRQQKVRRYSVSQHHLLPTCVLLPSRPM
jgi:hypothetical protein